MARWATGSSSRARSRGRPLRAAEPPSRDAARDELALAEADLVALAARIQRAAVERSLTLATAESCTGGLIGHLLTEVPGSSAYYVGGLVSYSNSLKEAELGVSRETLDRHGAALAVAVTGIAGPDGGTPQKPVGLTYVAIADAGGHDVRRFTWEGDRHANKLASAAAALRLVADRLGLA